MDASTLLKFLRDARYQEVIGAFEGPEVEFKSQPYNLAIERQKFELAKDISAFANADGGIIVVGYSTLTDVRNSVDQVDKFRPVPNESIDKQRIASVVESWLFPSLREIVVDVFPDADPAKCVAAIQIPKAPDRDWPILVRKPALSDETVVEALVGYFERRRSHVSHYSVERLHSLLRDGLLRRDIASRFDALEARIDAQLPEKKTELTKLDEDIRFVLARSAAKLTYMPVFTLAATPKTPIEIPEIFEARNSRIVSLIEKPPELRQGGFDLDLGSASKIERGDVRRISLPEYGAMDVYRDGAVIYVCRADGEGLAWGRRERQKSAILINQLVLIEKTTLFFEFLKRLYEGKENFRAVVQLAIFGAVEGDFPFLLEQGPLDDWPRKTREAPSSRGVFALEISRDDLSDPAKSAAHLVQKIYNWFGMDNSQIPYLVSGSVAAGFDLEQLKRGGRSSLNAKPN